VRIANGWGGMVEMTTTDPKSGFIDVGFILGACSVAQA
jgi:hypothetical protein